jgi:glycosyltransferase involved in cell wall biosynthesis
MTTWYQTAAVDVVLQVEHDSLGRTVFNPVWLYRHRDEFDVYHIQWEIRLARFPLLLASLLLCRHLKKRILWTAHEPLPHQQDFLLRSWLSGFALARLADVVIAHNDFTAGEVQRLFLSRRKIEVIEHPDYLVHPLPQAQAKGSLQEKRFIFLSFGYFNMV